MALRTAKRSKQVKVKLRAIQFRDFSATVLRHTTPDALQVCFLALTHRPYAREGPKQGHKAKPIPGVPKSTNSWRKQDAPKRKTAPNPGTRKRETDTEQQASSGQVETTWTQTLGDHPKYATPAKLSPAIPRERSSPLEHNPFIILCRDGLKAAMRVEYCVLHSQVAFVVQDVTCAINHPTRVVRVNVKGQIPQSSSQATAEAA